MDKTKIIYFIFPEEIDIFERSILQLKRASNYSDTTKYLSVDAILNISDNNFDWEKSKLPKEYFRDRFLYIQKYVDFCETESFNVDEAGIYNGVNDWRRFHLRRNEDFNLIMLDTDIYFQREILYVLENVIRIIEQETKTYMISPSIAKFWDSSWDVLGTKRYIDSDTNFDEIDVFGFDKNLDDISIIKQFPPKFGAGWFTFFSKELVKYIDTPDGLGNYGYDDDYWTEQVKILNQKYNVPQFIIKGLLIQEDRKYYHSNYYYKKYVHRLNIDRKIKKKVAYSVMNDELIKFQRKILENK
jgi:hypothetical protein